MIAYAVTDPSTLDFNHVKQDLQRFALKASMIVYRDKDTPHYTNNAKVFLLSAKYSSKYSNLSSLYFESVCKTPFS